LNIQGAFINLISLIVAAVDHKKRFIDLTVGWPGSVADGRVWANSSLKRKLEMFLSPLPAIPVATINEASETTHELISAFILADSAYPNTRRVVTTFKNTECDQCPITKRLNRKLASARYCVENAFGICKGRFRIFHRPLECAAEDVTRAIILVVAVCTLHNFLIDVHDDTEIHEEPRRANETFETREDEDLDNSEREDPLSTTRTALWRYVRWLEAEDDDSVNSR